MKLHENTAAAPQVPCQECARRHRHTSHWQEWIAAFIKSDIKAAKQNISISLKKGTLVGKGQMSKGIQNSEKNSVFLNASNRTGCPTISNSKTSEFPVSSTQPLRSINLKRESFGYFQSNFKAHN